MSVRDYLLRRNWLILRLTYNSLCIGNTGVRGDYSESPPLIWTPPGGGGGRTLGISGRECAAGTLEPLTYTRASSAKFCYPILE